MSGKSITEGLYFPESSEIYRYDTKGKLKRSNPYKEVGAWLSQCIVKNDILQLTLGASLNTGMIVRQRSRDIKDARLKIPHVISELLLLLIPEILEARIDTLKEATADLENRMYPSSDPSF